MKKPHVYKYQKDIARCIAMSIINNGNVILHIPCGYGRAIIMQQVADYLNPRHKDWLLSKNNSNP